MYRAEDIEYGTTKYPDAEVVQAYPTEYAARYGNDGDFVTENEERDLSRGLHQRHVRKPCLAVPSPAS